jgi:hypothetical protein
MERRALTEQEQCHLDRLRQRLAMIARYGNWDSASLVADEILNLLGYRRKM